MNRTALPMTLAWLLTVGLLGFLEEEVGSKETPHAKAEGKREGKKGRRASGKKDPASVPIVAPLFAAGMEVVIRPMPEKLKALGVSLEQIQELRYRRFFRGKWRTEIGGKEIDLTKVATLSVRKLHAPPFTVILPDGRKAFITPKRKRIGAYLITGESFEEDVREVLADPFIPEPGKARVLHGIRVPGGDIPNYWGKDHVHISLGEPLERFAKVKIRGRKGPQAADLERMRQIRTLLAKTLAKEEKIPRKVFEKRFGPGKKTQDPDKSGWLYPVGAGQLQVWYEREPDLVVSSISYWSGPEPQPGAPRDYGKEASAVWQMDRALLLAFLHKRYQRMTSAEKAKLREYLTTTQPVVRWTVEERKLLLRGGKKK